MTANSTQVGGTHYQTNGVQHWDLIGAMGLEYYIGNATKYISRWRKKNGIQDLQKAQHYVAKLLEVTKTQQNVPWPCRWPNPADFATWAVEAELTTAEIRICGALMYAKNRTDIRTAAAGLADLIAKVENLNDA